MKSPRPTPSAHAGLAEWLLQRASAVYLGIFSIWLLVRFGFAPITDHAAWKAWFAQGPVRLAWALAFASLLIHAWIGMRSVFLDYVKPLWVRVLAQTLLAFGLSALALWAAQILLEVAR